MQMWKSSKEIPRSFWMMKEALHACESYEIRQYCNVCSVNIADDKDSCDVPDCLSSTNGDVGTFVVFDLYVQLRHLFLRPSFVEMRHYKSHREKIDDNSYEDIMDGEKWHNSFHIYDREDNVVCDLSADGIPLFSSSGVSVWAVWLVYYDLPPMERYKRTNMTLAAISVGKKPVMNVFLESIVEQICQSHTKPLPISVNGTTIPITMHVINVSADLPAKASLLNMHQFNGEYGCMTCMAPGTVLVIRDTIQQVKITSAELTTACYVMQYKLLTQILALMAYMDPVFWQDCIILIFPWT
eukprot:Pompholyxophrys_sp_v1_NODE_26_length_3750_cov_7.232206.p1 type:complete len:298 gc:universal NODE_26_length_3750_cov_7.232206:1526-633(-)